MMGSLLCHPLLRCYASIVRTVLLVQINTKDLPDLPTQPKRQTTAKNPQQDTGSFQFYP